MLCERRNPAPEPYRLADGEPLTQGFGVGGFASHCVIDQRSLVQLPTDVPLRVAALLGCAVATGLGAVANIAHLEVGAEVLVLGAGAVGLSIIMGAHLAGAASVTVVEPREARREAARAVGATQAFEDVSELPTEPKFDFAFEATGATGPMAAAVRLTRPGGTVTLLGVPAADAELQIPALDFVASQRRLLGCITGDVRPHADIPRWIELYRAGRLPIEQLIHTVRPLSELDDAMAQAVAGEGARIIIDPSGEAA